MIKAKFYLTLASILFGCFCLCPAQSAPDKSTKIFVGLPSGVADTPLSGRLYVMFERNIYAQPLQSRMPDEHSFWLATDVRDWQPGTGLTLAGDVISYPFSAADLPEGDYAAWVLLDTNTVERGITESPGNLYSDAIAVVIRGDGTSDVRLTLEHKIAKQEVRGTGFLKEVKPESRLLSDYLKRPTSVKAIVVLPPSYYRTPSREYATVFVMPGFESPYTAALDGDLQIRRYGMNTVGQEKIFVFLDQECPLGYHGFVDSENNGPWGKALMEEFIPHLEKTFRMYRDPSTRFLTGQSSGAWAGLWLQINYPDQFGGVWACSPDPVDFEQFLGINIYGPNANLLFDESGVPIELNRFLSDANRVIGDGWVLNTFEAVFSPRGADGRPRELWNRETGEIDPDVAAAWRKFDLRLVLQDK
ncbi:MAG: hypothetical protein KKA42_03045 [candidate division Zixibacteria bacterium]|nr:hypothetical protein [candidate division Zixibacteria bacterium]